MEPPAPAPVAPEAAPVAPVAPAPTAPVTPPATPTPDEAAAEADAKEWDDAADEFFPGLKSTKKKEEKKPNEQTDTTTTTTETPQTTTTTTIDPNETPEQKTAREAKEAADAAADAEEDEPDTTARDARLAQRESARQAEIVKADVRKQMFADVPQQLQDADGDPIKSIEDVMKLINPRTKEPFTEEDAGMWLLAAQQQFNQNLANTEKQIEQIAEVNVDLKDQADSISYQYGELLKAMPKVRDQIWAEYEKTLVKDEKSGIIIKAPVSLERFYEIALQPYAKLAENLEAEETAKAAEDAKIAAETAKKNSRADRSDIFGGSSAGMTDTEDAEWNEAATTVFGPRKA